MTILSNFNRNLIFLTLLSLLWAWQILLASSFILNHFPASSSLSAQVLPEWRYLLKPEWKPFIYHLVLIAAIVIQGALLWFNRKSMDAKDLLGTWMAYFVIEIVLTFFLCTAAFKIIIYSAHPELATNAFVILLLMACTCKFFADCWHGWMRRCWSEVLYLKKDAVWQHIAEWAVPAGLFILLFIPNIEGIVARMFIGEQFHHNDSFIMGPGWAYVSGQALDVDTISQYGMGFVVVISRLAQLIGGFTYEHVIGMMVYLSVIYYLAWYFLIRRWLGSLVLAAAVMVIGIKWQLFHIGALPFVFTYGGMTPVRFLYDVIYFWCLWMHINTGEKKWLVASAAACGFGIFYLTSEGIYATASFGAYFLLLAALPAWRKFFRLRLQDTLILGIPFVMAFILLTLAIGPKIMTPDFSSNIGEFINYFLSGFGLEYFYKTLLEHKYLQSLMGFVIPIFYVLTLLILLSRLAVNAAQKQDWFPVVLCFYGFGTFHYYVERSDVTSYYAVCLPYVFLLGFWARAVIGCLQEHQQTPARLILLGVCSWALVTNHMFLSYPNMINLSSHPLTDTKISMSLPDGHPYFNHLFRFFEPGLKLSVNSLGGTREEILQESDFKDDAELVEYYRKNSRFAQDADLIASLTARSDEVPLISGFEIEMLMQAKRKPFFYYFPLLISRPMTMRCFEACSIYTTDQLDKTIKKFEDQKPPYIFMERIYMVNEIPRAYLFQFPSLVPLVNYVRTHYTPVAQGEYLVALKRNSSS